MSFRCARITRLGGRKIRCVLDRRDLEASTASTVIAILRCVGRLDGPRAGVAIRSALSMPPPNDLWQMDIMGHVATASGRCHPLTIIDDHARYTLEVRACGNGTTETAGDRLQVVFRRLCLPARILAYNGPQGGERPVPTCATPALPSG